MADILLVDDEELMRDAICEILSDMEHVCDPCSSGTEALEKLASGKSYDLVITDVVMPDVDGRELVRRILNNPVNHDLPVIVMSGQVSVTDVADVLALGDVQFLGKPIRMLALQQAVRNALS